MSISGRVIALFAMSLENDPSFTKQRSDHDVIAMLSMIERKCEQASVDISKDAFMKRMTFIQTKQGPEEPWSAYFT